MSILYANLICMKNLVRRLDQSIKKTNDGNPYLDFQEILPAPDELNPESDRCMECGSYMFTAVGAFLNGMLDFAPEMDIALQSKIPDSAVKKICKQRGITMTKAIDDGRAYMKNFVDHYAFDWAGWRRVNWGCESNGLNLTIVSDDIVTFQTINGYPHLYMRDLSFENSDEIVTLIAVKCQDGWKSDSKYHSQVLTYTDASLVNKVEPADLLSGCSGEICHALKEQYDAIV